MRRHVVSFEEIFDLKKNNISDLDFINKKSFLLNLIRTLVYKNEQFLASRNLWKF